MSSRSTVCGCVKRVDARFQRRMAQEIPVSADVERSPVQNLNLDAVTLRSSARAGMDDAGNSTFDAARISRFEVTRVAVPRRWRSFHGLGAAVFCVRGSDSAQLSSYALLHSRVVASRVCGRGRSESPSTAVACLGYQLNSVSPDGDGAARRWGCNHRTLVSAVTHG